MLLSISERDNSVRLCRRQLASAVHPSLPTKLQLKLRWSNVSLVDKKGANASIWWWSSPQFLSDNLDKLRANQGVSYCKKKTTLRKPLALHYAHKGQRQGQVISIKTQFPVIYACIMANKQLVAYLMLCSSSNLMTISKVDEHKPTFQRLQQVKWRT